jgi:hypothetical protein
VTLGRHVSDLDGGAVKEIDAGFSAPFQAAVPPELQGRLSFPNQCHAPATIRKAASTPLQYVASDDGREFNRAARRAVKLGGEPSGLEAD